MSADAADDPVVKLLNELIARDDERQEELAALKLHMREVVEKGIARLEGGQKRNEEEFRRQDSQLRAIEQRIAGNYAGQSAQFDTITDELRGSNGRLGLVEEVLVKVHRSQSMLHGRFIEESDRSGGKIKQSADDIVALGVRMANVERTLEVQGGAPNPQGETVLGAAGASGGGRGGE